MPEDAVQGEAHRCRVNCVCVDTVLIKRHHYHDETDLRTQPEHESKVQAMVIAELGYAIMPASLAINPRLSSRPWVDPRTSPRITVATRQGRCHMPIVARLVNLCKRTGWGIRASSGAEIRRRSHCTAETQDAAFAGRLRSQREFGHAV